MKNLIIVSGLLVCVTSLGHAMNETEFDNAIRETNWPKVAQALNELPGINDVIVGELLKRSSTELNHTIGEGNPSLFEALLLESVKKREYDNPGSRKALKALIKAEKIRPFAATPWGSLVCNTCGSLKDLHRQELITIIDELKKEEGLLSYFKYPAVIVLGEMNIHTMDCTIEIQSPLKALATNYKFWGLSAAAALFIIASICWYRKKTVDTEQISDQENDTATPTDTNSITV